MGLATVSDENSELSSASFSDKMTRSSTGCSTPVFHSMHYNRSISSLSGYVEHSDEQGPPHESHSTGWSLSTLAEQASPSYTKLSMKKHAVISATDNVVSAEVEMMKEKFAKLLLGEEVSGSGKGVCSAVALSNAITNLYATVFGQCYKLEPLPPEKKTMWRREMECLLSVCDYIVEFYPSTQTLPNGTTLEVMATRPRSDLFLNLPALEKLDAVLIDMLDSFEKTEFWYVEEGKESSKDPSKTFKRVVQRNEDKWWLPLPCIAPTGLSKKACKELQQKRDCANQIHKAAMAINSSILAEMEIPDSYIATLPKSGRVGIGDAVYHYMFSCDQFSPHYLLDTLKISSEHDAVEFADRIEASMNVWHRKASLQTSKSSWDMMKDLVADENKNQTLASRAESLLQCLKQKYPGLAQTTLDTCKIQHNTDIGQAILESYSRVLESLAYNLVAWIDDILFVDSSVKKRLEAEDDVPGDVPN